MKNLALVYMCAGLSSRFGGKIKQFAKIGPNRETLIEYSLNQAIHSGFTKIIFIVGEKTAIPFKKKFWKSYKGIPIYYAFQNFEKENRDKPWGTLDALCSAKKYLDCPFVICNGDDIYGENTFKTLANHLTTNKTNATVGYKLSKVLPLEGEVNRGIINMNSNNNIKDIIETYNISFKNLKSKNLNVESLCSMNIWALHPKTLSYLNDTLIRFKEKYKNNKLIESLLPEEISNLIKDNKISIKLYPTSEKWFGVTNPEDEEKIRIKLKKYKN